MKEKTSPAQIIFLTAFGFGFIGFLIGFTYGVIQDSNLAGLIGYFYAVPGFGIGLIVGIVVVLVRKYRKKNN